jgi:alpha/beta superfamily hydrolase
MTLPRAEPVFFGNTERPLFGWIHRVADNGASNGADSHGPESHAALAPVGLVLCNPFGYEAISTHRTLRHFAEAAAAAGIPALRFDYDGTGDSAGSDLDPDRLRAWVDSVHSAADTLRREAGCGRVCLLGIRLGATVAALAASERTDVGGLIAIAPVVNAKAYIRELRALQMATGAAGSASDAGPDDPMEVTGFLISTETRNALTQLDLMKLERAPAPAVLVLDRSDLPGAERWARHLQSSRAETSYHAMPGYVEMMLSPHSTVIPAEMLRRTIEWLSTRSGPTPSSGGPPAAIANPAASARLEPFEGTSVPACRGLIQLPAAAAGGVPVIETVEFLDSEKILLGILSTPAPAPAIASDVEGVGAVASLPSRPAILFLNAGATHHVGPNRLYVALARRWASLGNVVLRMDISGIGDSLSRPGEPENAVYTARAGEDILQAVRYLRERTGATECRAVGLCSGAYHAFKAAVSGAPLDAVVMINPLTFFWKEGMSLDAPLPDARVVSEAQRYQKSAFSLKSWLKLARGGVNLRKVAHVMIRRNASVIKHRSRDFARLLRLPLPDDLASELESVAKRRVGMLFVFAARDPGIELLKIQGGAAAKSLRERNQVEMRVIDDADHTFTVRLARERLISVLAAELDGAAARAAVKPR